METKGLKPLLQVSTRWVALLEPLRRLLADYRTLLAKMKSDMGKNDTAEIKYCPSFFSIFFLYFVCSVVGRQGVPDRQGLANRQFFPNWQRVCQGCDSISVACL